MWEEVFEGIDCGELFTGGSGGAGLRRWPLVSVSPDIEAGNIHPIDAMTRPVILDPQCLLRRFLRRWSRPYY